MKRRLPLLLTLLAAFYLAVPAGAKDLRKIIILLGPPGVGKSTQGKIISKEHKIPMINAADLAKAEIGKKSKIGKSMKASLASGEFLHDDVLNALMEKRVLGRDALQGFILDGYPRTLEQARYFDKVAEKRGLPAPIVLHLDAPDAVLLARMKKRGRVDDKAGLSEPRLKAYREQAAPLVDWYKSRRYHLIDASRLVDEIAREIAGILAGYEK